MVRNEDNDGAERRASRRRPLRPHGVRRRGFLAASAAWTALVLAACSSGSSSSTPTAGASESPGTDRVTVRHEFGKTRIQGDPKRIVSVGYTDQDMVYALGDAERLIAAKAWYDDRIVYPWTKAVAPQADPKKLPPGEVHVEKIAALKPDLILAVSGRLTKDMYKLLSKVAPTVAGVPGETDTWQEQTRLVSQALGKPAKGKSLIADVTTQFEQAADRHPDWHQQEAVLASQYLEGKLLVYPGDSLPYSLLSALGFRMKPGLDTYFSDTYDVIALSAERIDLIDSDLVLWDVPQEFQRKQGLLDLKLYQRLDARKEGRMVFPPSMVTDALSFRSVLSWPWALTRLEPAITAAVDGDPETEVVFPGS